MLRDLERQIESHYPDRSKLVDWLVCTRFNQIIVASQELALPGLLPEPIEEKRSTVRWRHARRSGTDAPSPSIARSASSRLLLRPAFWTTDIRSRRPTKSLEDK